jgi:hypothetical protein
MPRRDVKKISSFHCYLSEMSMAALLLPRRTRGGGSGSLFFITIAARRGSGSFQKKKI